MVETAVEDWGIFEYNDGRLVTTSMTIIASNFACIAVHFDNEFHHMTEDLTRIIKFENGQWSATDYEENIEIVVNLRGQSKITNDDTIYMVFINSEGIAYFIGENNRQTDIYQAIGLQHDFVKSFWKSILIDDRLILLNCGLIIVYKEGSFINITNNLYYKHCILDQNLEFYDFRFDDIIFSDDTYYLAGFLKHNRILLYKKDQEDDWHKIEIKNLSGSFCGFVDEGEFILLYTTYYVLKINKKTHEVTYHSNDLDRFEFYVKCNDCIYGITTDRIMNLTRKIDLLKTYKKTTNREISFYEKYEVFDDVLYVFGPLGSFIAIDKNDQVTLFPAPEMVIDVDTDISNIAF